MANFTREQARINLNGLIRRYNEHEQEIKKTDKEIDELVYQL